MNLAAILERLSARAKEMSLNDTQVSRLADGSTDLVRNWRRSLKKDATLQPRFDSLQQVAATLGVTTEWLIDGRGPETPRPTGFAENEAAPWHPPPGFVDDPSGVAASMTRTAGKPSAFIVHADLAAFGLLAGDVLIVDQRRVPDAGDLALGNAMTDAGEFVTLIGRYFPPSLVTAAALSTGRAPVVDHARVSLYHPVIASFRSYVPDNGGPRK